VVPGTFGSAAWRVPVRDAFIGWDPVQRSDRLERVVCNQRLCVLPAAGDVPHAASRALAAMLRRLPGDHQRAFGIRPAAVESFTDPAAHAGTTYEACGFTLAGRTAGYGRSRGAAHFTYHGQPKAYWIRELAPGALHALTAAFDSRPLTGRAGPDFNALNVGGDGGLPDFLARVADHRKPKGIRHGLAAILAVIVVARLSGADSVCACGQFAASMPQEALARCGIRYSKRPGRYVPPSPKTIKRAVRAVDAAAADEQMCARLRAEAAAGRLRWRHIAVDGKTVRGAKDDDGKAPHLLSAYDVTAGTGSPRQVWRLWNLEGCRAMAVQKKYPDELRERAVKMIFEIRGREGKGHGELARVARQPGVSHETIRTWVQRAEIDDGIRPGTTTDDRQRIAELERENRELRRANEILKAASAYFARELDPRLPR
jgi:transposase-like protein